jgi:sulfonate transport system ATP-binding protein
MPGAEFFMGCSGMAVLAVTGAESERPQEENISMHVHDPGAGAPIGTTGLHKAFGGRQVLQGVDVSVAPGEFVAIVGRSGCGKSTLLRLMAGLDIPSAGTVALDGQAPRPGSSVVRMMFQDARLLPWRRVVDNVALGLPPGRRAEAKAALEEVGLAERGGDWPSILSGGQRQRVALARALASRPQVLLLDEPLGALDALTRLEMQGLIERVWQEHRFTAVLVTHDVEEAVALADRIIVLSEGQIALDLRIDLPRPRDHAALRFTELKATVLDEVLGTRHERGARMHALSSAPADITSERLVRTA